MIERVAQAIFAKDPEGLFTIHQARVYARAAIAAMREPSEDMVTAKGENIMGCVDLLGQHLDYWSAKGVWQAMIDAALEDK
jgi:hypothetical protein